MVYYSQQARADLHEMFESLLSWQTANHQHKLTYELVLAYHNDLLVVSDSLDNLSYHRKAVYRLHKQFGAFVYQYKRNFRTSWYIIYNRVGKDVFIERIINNYKTV